MWNKPTLRGKVAQWWDRWDPRVKLVLMLLLGLIVLALFVGAALTASRSCLSRSEPTPTTAPPTSTLPMPPTATPIPTPTDTPAPTETPMPESPLPTPVPTDPQGDVGAYEDGAPVEAPPAGADIRVASVGPDLRVVLQPTEGVPAELAEWAAEAETGDEALLWIALYEPVPDPPTAYTEWIFALDLDGDVETGRPADSARINPDIGMEVAIAAYYQPTGGEYASYFLVWDPAQGGWVNGPGELRFTLDESRTLVGLALPLETLTQAVAQITGVTVAPEAVRGRAAVVSRVGEQRVIDFYPDRPD